MTLSSLLKMIDPGNHYRVFPLNYVRRVLHMLLKRYGKGDVKKRVWNTEFSSEKWDYLEPKGPDSKIKDPI
jgi:hypothetical protein